MRFYMLRVPNDLRCWDTIFMLFSTSYFSKHSKFKCRSRSSSVTLMELVPVKAIQSVALHRTHAWDLCFSYCTSMILRTAWIA